MPRSNPKPSTDSQWLATSLSSLLAAPHVHIADESPLLPTGPGPVDVFSTKFEQMFVPDARGFVAGREIDREELKETLLGLQRRWNAAEGSCAGCEVHPTHITEFHPTMAARMEFTPLYKYPREREIVIAEASGQHVDGHECITCLMLEGDETLFRPEF